jgi:hypothetical protein
MYVHKADKLPLPSINLYGFMKRPADELEESSIDRVQLRKKGIL